MKDGLAETRSSFLRAMAEAATSVTLSADPPMLLACINRKSPAAAAIAANGGYCVNVLSAAQSFLADVFAGRSERFASYDFGCAAWQRADGGWRLSEAVASFDCALDRDIAAGTHQVLIGRVLATHRDAQADASSLIYARRAYSIAQPLFS